MFIGVFPTHCIADFDYDTLAAWEYVGDADWCERTAFATCVYDDKIWVMGGTTGGTRLNDVWYTSNGVNWTQATANAGWSPRYGLALCVHDDAMWVIGGSTNEWPAQGDEVWNSTDGVTWTKVSESNDWAWDVVGYFDRFSMRAYSYDGDIWIVGGNLGGGDPQNTTWYSSDGITWTQGGDYPAEAYGTELGIVAGMFCSLGSQDAYEGVANNIGGSWMDVGIDLDTPLNGAGSYNDVTVTDHESLIVIDGYNNPTSVFVFDGSGAMPSWDLVCDDAPWENIGAGSGCAMLNDEFYVFGVDGISNTIYKAQAPDPVIPPESDNHLYWKLVTDAIDQDFPNNPGYEDNGAYFGEFFELDGYLYLLTYPNGKLWRSATGSSWTLVNTQCEPFDPDNLTSGEVRYAPAIGVYNSTHIIVIGGAAAGAHINTTGDVWSSDDGLAWSLVNSSAWADRPPYEQGQPVLFSMPVPGIGTALMAYGVGSELGEDEDPNLWGSIDGGATWMFFSTVNASKYPKGWFDGENYYVLNSRTPSFRYPGMYWWDIYSSDDCFSWDLEYQSEIYSSLIGGLPGGKQQILTWDDKFWILGRGIGGSAFNLYSPDPYFNIFYADRAYSELPYEGELWATYPFDVAGQPTIPEKIYGYFGESPDGGQIWVAGYFPQADFVAYPTTGVAPLKVRFYDLSTNSPTNWL